MVEFATGDSGEYAEDALAEATSGRGGSILYIIRTRGWTSPEARGGRYCD